ncbi:MAG: GNAT family N-acetyltransferase [Paracoccus sp. (in: a-proteobacteria)]|uniref:GNAT family N-acetyltransferase n=1 Tax=Paracoccus sp. TaxID=267 RepID=UPI0026DF37D6|nr:GNAT family N-acetyltransferase [Paracoccus sp. (in: a-proteobacteria)]MDO5633037.1 GNAT family N-acetyltransferase [Paracoccus sp. (in: a-proteobacteria)]
MTPITVAEIPATLDWLAANAQGPVFLESNLRHYGLNGDDPRSVRIWRDAAGMVGLTKGGVLLPQLPGGNWAAARVALSGQTISGIIGAEDQVQAARAALALNGATTLDRGEPAFALTLADMTPPDTTGLDLRGIAPADLPLLYRWNADYRVEILGDDPATAERLARANIDTYAAEQSHRILWRGSAPLAMTGFNARLPDLVQIGGVYTPPGLRGRGYARAAVALHLAEARAQGISRAFLFAASDTAARAYTAIGFRPAGRVRLLILAQPQRIP